MVVPVMFSPLGRAFGNIGGPGFQNRYILAAAFLAPDFSGLDAVLLVLPGVGALCNQQVHSQGFMSGVINAQGTSIAKGYTNILAG